VPIPFTIGANGFGTSPAGFTTTDNGITWKPLTPPFPDTRLGWQITNTISNSENEIAIGYQARSFDTARGIFVPIGPIRLAYTTDGGAAWTFADSLVIDTISGTGSIRYELHDTTAFGVIPTPAGMTEVFSRGWSQIESFISPTQIRVVAAVYGRIGTVYQTRFYLGTLDITTRRATWQPLPFREALPTESVLPAGVRFIDASTGYAVQSRNPMTTPSFLIWRTLNGGTTWDTLTAPSTIDFASFRFINGAFGASSNAITRDSGRTWTFWAHPYESALFYALDSTNFYVAARNALTAHSTDAGRNWERNASGGLPRSILAHRGHVVVGRNYGSLLVSSDAGLTWKDVDLEGGTPDRMAVVWALSYVDSNTAGVNSIRGVASFVEYDGRTYYAIIASSNGGATWTKGMELPQLTGAGSTIAMTFANSVEIDPVGFLTSSKGLLVSTDEGVTWTLRDTIALRSLVMSSMTEGVGTTLDGIYRTSNAGTSWTKVQPLTANRNRPVGLRAFSSDIYRGLFPDRTLVSKTWDLAASTAAASWSVSEHSGAPRPLDGYGYWIDPQNIYVVGRGATIQSSSDGGASFTLKQDTVGAFKGTSGWIVATSDSNHYYVIGAGNVAGRWSFFETPPVGVRESHAADGSTLEVVSSGDGSTVAIVSMKRRGDATIQIHNMLGEIVHEERLADATAGAHAVTIPTGSIGSGSYLISLVSGGQRVSKSFVVAR
jgi:hypothetical protein